MRHPRRSCLNLIVQLTVVLWPAIAAAQSVARAPDAPVPPPPVTTELRTQFITAINNLGLQQSPGVVAPPAGGSGVHRIENVTVTDMRIEIGMPLSRVGVYLHWRTA